MHALKVMATIVYCRTEETYDYIELSQRMTQYPPDLSAVASPDYCTINEYATPEYATPEYAIPNTSNGTAKQTNVSHDYFVLERPEELSNQSAVTQEAQMHVYSTPIRKEGKKAPSDHTSSDTPQHQWDEMASVSHDGESNPTPCDELPMTSGATYSTVVRQDGEKIAIKIQEPTDST